MQQNSKTVTKLASLVLGWATMITGFYISVLVAQTIDVYFIIGAILVFIGGFLVGQIK